MAPNICVIVVNWNGWRHTVECLESVFRNEYQRYQVVVCDNGSGDNSTERIAAWAGGKLQVDLETSNPLRRLTSPPVKKPIPSVQCERTLAEGGGASEWENVRLIVVQNRANLGFAEGNNVGIRYALASGRFDFCWLLNNDTVIEREALRHAVERMLRSDRAGMCGSTILFYSEPTRIQSLGGASYNKWTGVPRCVGECELFRPGQEAAYYQAKLDYVNGASLLVSTQFVRDVGLMSTRYFLYYEELDWAIRAKGRYSIVYAPGSIVYHKGGMSIGSSRDPLDRSELSDYYGLLGRLTLTKTFYPYALPTVYLSFVVTIINRIRRRQWSRIWIIGKVFWRHLLSFVTTAPSEGIPTVEGGMLRLQQGYRDTL